MSFIPIDHNFAGRVRRVFRKQQVIRTLGVEILRLEPGEIELTMPFAPASNRTDSSTQGIITTALDARQRLRLCGLSLMPADAAVLTVEFKTNLIAPGQRRAFHLSRIRSKARKDLDRLRCPPTLRSTAATSGWLPR